MPTSAVWLWCLDWCEGTSCLIATTACTPSGASVKEADDDYREDSLAVWPLGDWWLMFGSRLEEFGDSFHLVGILIWYQLSKTTWNSRFIFILDMHSRHTSLTTLFCLYCAAIGLYTPCLEQQTADISSGEGVGCPKFRYSKERIIFLWIMEW